MPFDATAPDGWPVAPGTWTTAPVEPTPAPTAAATSRPEPTAGAPLWGTLGPLWWTTAPAASAEPPARATTQPTAGRGPSRPCPSDEWLSGACHPARLQRFIVLADASVLRAPLRSGRSLRGVGGPWRPSVRLQKEIEMMNGVKDHLPQLQPRKLYWNDAASMGP